MCETKGFQNRLPNIVLANFGRPLPPLIVEQTPTALLVEYIYQITVQLISVGLTQARPNKLSLPCDTVGSFVLHCPDGSS